MLIVFEGIDGSGKSTVLANVAGQLAAAGTDYICTSELGRTDSWSVNARQHLMAADSPVVEYAAIRGARAVHASQVIRPALARGDVVLMDLYLMSTLAYQSSKELPYTMILQEHFKLNLPTPDLVILLRVDVETALHRLQRRDKRDAIDQRPLSFFRNASEGLAESSFDLADLGLSIQPVDANRSLQQVVSDVMLRIETVLQGAPA